MIFLDSNIVLRFVLDDNPKLSPKASGIFSRISSGEVKVFIPWVVLAEIVYVLLKVYKLKKDVIVEKLMPVISLENIMMSNKNIYKEVFRMFVGKNVDFEDAYQVALMGKKNVKEIYSFDEDFNKFPQIKRLID